MTFFKMSARRRCRSGGSIDAFNTGVLARFATPVGARVDGTRHATDFYPPSLARINTLGNQIVIAIKTYLAIDNAVDRGADHVNTYDENVADLTHYGQNTLAAAFGINDKVPVEFYRYIPTFVVYDALHVKAGNAVRGSDNEKQFLEMANIIRTVLPTSDNDNFGKWETFYHDFKSGKYSGGLASWKLRKAAETPYDPVDPIFDFRQEPKLKIPHVSETERNISDALYAFNVKPLTRAEIKNGLSPLLQGGRLRRAARTSRRRI